MTTVTRFSSYINSTSQRSWCCWLWELKLLLIKMVTINESAKWCSNVIRLFVRSFIHSFGCFHLIPIPGIKLAYVCRRHSAYTHTHTTLWLPKMDLSLWQCTVPKIWFSKLAKHLLPWRVYCKCGFAGSNNTEKYHFLSSSSSCARLREYDVRNMEPKWETKCNKAERMKKKEDFESLNKFARRSFSYGFLRINRLQFILTHFWWCCAASVYTAQQQQRQ